MMRRANRKPGGGTVGGGLLHFGLAVLAIGIGVGLFFAIGLLADYWNFDLAFLGLGVASGLFFFWRRRPHFAGAAVLGLVAGVLGLVAGGAKAGGPPWATLLGALAIAALFWPVLALLLD